MSEITKEAYDAAIVIVREFIRQEIIKVAQANWDDPDDYTREEYEADGETFDDYIRTFMSDAMEDECPAGVDILNDVFSGMVCSAD